MKKAADMIVDFSEHYTVACELIKRNEFSQFGLTDTGILETAKNGGLIISMDFDLVAYANKCNLEAVNFNHIRRLS